MKKSEIFAAVAHEMKRLGFTRRKSNYEHLLDLGNGFEGWCSFADATKGQRSTVWIAPIVGVRCAEAEDRIMAWCGDVVPGWDGRSYVPTVSMNIGYLTPQAQWREHPISLTEASPAENVRSLVSDITEIALPFLRKHASYAGVATALRTYKGQLPQRRLERLPLILMRQGDIDGATGNLLPSNRR